MPRIKNKDLKTAISGHFDTQIQDVILPETPAVYDSLLKRAESIIEHDFRRTGSPDPDTGRRSAGFIVFRAAAAALLIACGAALFAYTGKQNQLAELVQNIAEERAVNEKITAGLQKAGRFLDTHL